MSFLSGIKYNLQGLIMGLKTPRLLMWGILRFLVVVVITLVAAGFVFSYHQEILEALWHKPASHWVLWLWVLLSWLLSMALTGFSVVVSYLISQVLFSVMIMDLMSRITEKMITGSVREPEKISAFRWFAYLMRQEIPRATIPILLSLLLLVLGWLTPLGPVIAVVSSGLAAVFLAWDNTDLVPARHLEPFGARFRFLMSTLGFHLGFGILFLVPVLNILLLSFAPVGATLYHLKRNAI